MAKKQSAAKSHAAAKPKTPAAPRIVVEEVTDPEFEGRYLGAFVARKGNVKSEVRSTREKAEADLLEKLAAL